MALTFEQQTLLNSINERVGEIQTAIRQALPGNRALHEEFFVGQPAPQSPKEAVALARKIEPLARENRTLLVGRGIDGAKISHLVQMAATLEKLSLEQESAAPAPVVAPVAAAPAATSAAEEGEKKGGKRKKG